MKVFAIKNHRGNIEVSNIATGQQGEIEVEVVETKYPLTGGNGQSWPMPGEVISVNGVIDNCQVRRGKIALYNTVPGETLA